MKIKKLIVNYLSIIVSLFFVFSCKLENSKKEQNIDQNDKVLIDSMTTDGIHIKGQLINGVRQGTWTFETDSTLVKRLYVLGDIFYEEIKLNDSIVKSELNSKNTENLIKKVKQ